MLCITFLSVSRNASKSATRGQHDMVSEELLDSAQQEILAKLNEAFSVEAGVGSSRKGHVAATPGLIEVRRYDEKLNRGNLTGAAVFEGSPTQPAFFSQPFSATFNGAPANPRWIPLFSWTEFAPRLKHLRITNGAADKENPAYNPAVSFNINTPNNPFTPGVTLISGVPQGAEVLVRERRDGAYAGSGSDADFRLSTGQSAGERPVWVQWIPVLKDPSQPPSTSNPMIGRYAYWVDVENTKLRADQPLRNWRDQPQYLRLAGEADGGEGGESWFSQGQSNSARLLREELEKNLPASAGDDEKEGVHEQASRGNAQVGGYAAGAASEAREAWLGWRDGNPPPMADARMVDWDFFEAPWPKNQQGLTVASAMKDYRNAWANDKASKPMFSWTLGSWTRFGKGSSETRAKQELLHQTAASSLTLFGHEEEVDPLGLPKLNLTDFQLAATSSRSAVVSTAAIRSHPLWSRLNDAAYYKAYYPGAWPNQGVSRSFVDSFNRFAGDGNASTAANGSAAAQQMLVNMAEFAQPDTIPPLIDTVNGIVGARSMPYVAEVTTRARSALYLLPEADRNDPAKILKKTNGAFAYNYGGKRLQYFATHVIVDLAIGLVNPNPFETKPFEGTLELEVGWGTLHWSVVKHTAKLPATGVGPVALQGTATSPIIIPINGQYTLTPEPNKDTKSAHVQGNTLFVRLGVLPAEVFHNLPGTYAAPLQVKGWKIKNKDGTVWHQVPVRHPGGKRAREWWRMAQPGQNAGKPADSWSLAGFLDGNRPVGWFCKDTVAGLISDSLYVSDWPEASYGVTEAANPALHNRVSDWMHLSPRSAALERVVSLDPVIGHRTGDETMSGAFGLGHFYGALGHTWRRFRVHQQAGSVGVTTTDNPSLREEVKSISASSWTFAPDATQTLSGKVRRASGDRLTVRSSTWDVPQWKAALLSGPVGGEFLTHAKVAGPGTPVNATTVAPDSLTAIYQAPTVEGPAPQGVMKFDDEFKDAFKLKTAGLENRDLETAPAPPDVGDFVKLPDGTKGARSFVCSAPAGRPFVSVGEIGFCHSGFVQTPIMVGPDEGRTPYQLNSAQNGPPMRMLMDLFGAVRFTDASGSALTQSQWMAGSGSAQATRHAWNVNTSIAHDEYMGLREGGLPLAELKKEVDPSNLAVRAVWLPNATGFARRVTGSEAFRGKEAKHVVEKNPGYVLDRHLRPYASFSRPWDMWMGVVGGDVSPARSGESLLWGVGNSAAFYFGPGYMTWEPGKGSGGESGNVWLDFASDFPAQGRLLAFGADGRKDDKNDNAGYLKGRFAADQNLDAFKAGITHYIPSHFVTRFSLFPVRHFISDLGLDFHQENQESEWTRFKTALNPAISASPLPDPTDQGSENEELKKEAAKLDGAGFPGGWNRSGIYYNAPMALLTNQAGVTANAFTAYIVVQTIRDNGQARQGVVRSGPGFNDPDDVILAQRWARVVIAKQAPTNASSAPTFRILAADVADR